MNRFTTQSIWVSKSALFHNAKIFENNLSFEKFVLEEDNGSKIERRS